MWHRVLFGFVLLTGGSTIEGQPPPDLSQLQAWVDAVRTHEPGELDEAVRTIATWPRPDFERAIPYIEALLALLKNPTLRPNTYRVRFSDSDLKAMVGLVSRPSKGGPSTFLRRAVVLHTDAVILAGNAEAFRVAAGRRPTTRTVGSMRQRVVVRAPDARYEGVEYGSLHWDLARRLVDEIVRERPSDLFGSEWYRATAAYFAAHHLFAEAQPHLEHARRVLPGNARILSSSGCLYESLSAPPTQHFVRSTVLPGGMIFDVPSEGASRRRAESYFRGALEFDPNLFDVRVRLGRVLASSDRQNEARIELRRASVDAPEATTRFYAALFTGHIEQTAGRREAAVEAYQQAAALFPRAPSVLMSLVSVASGDRRDGAITTLLASISEDVDDPSIDPWVDYYRCEGRLADDLLNAIRQRADAREE
jgi:tetratricopeptide (TPR) repeat protein